VWRFLLSRDISAFNPGRPAPLTVAKEKMIDASLSEQQRRAKEGVQMIRDAGIACFFMSDLYRFAAGIRTNRKYGVEGLSDVEKKQRATEMSAIKHALDDMGLHTTEKKLRGDLGNSVHGWIVMEPTKWCSAPPEAVRKQCALATKLLEEANK
jgi:phage major head subunit gpT-like protein